MSDHELPPSRKARASGAAPAIALPPELTLLPLLNVVIYPLTVMPLAISQEASVQLVDAAIAEHRMLGMVALRGASRPERLAAGDLQRVGTAAVVHRMVRLHDNTLRVAVEGVARFDAIELLQDDPPVARVRALPDAPLDRTARAEARALAEAAQRLARRLPAQSALVLEELLAEEDPLRLSFLAAARLLQRGSLADRQAALETPSTAERLALLRRVIERDIEALDR